MKLLLIAIISLSIFSCSQPQKTVKEKGKGTYKGNVYWKYNKFVGNRPDAGSLVYLYNLKDTSQFYFAKTDVRGDFTIDSIPEGLYFSIVQSKNTTGSPKDFYDEISLYAESLGELAKYDLKKVISEKKEMIHFLDSLKANSFVKYTGASALNHYSKYNDSINSVCSSLIRQLPERVRWKISILTPYSSKVVYDLVFITANKTETKVIDFGITYM
jgi:hypothetical protein